MPVRTSCIKSPQQSAKTTRLYVLKICRSAICPDQLQEPKKIPERIFVKNPGLTEAFWIKDGESFVANWPINLNGTEECYSQYLPNTPATNVPIAIILHKKIVRPTLSSYVSVVIIRITLTLSAR